MDEQDIILKARSFMEGLDLSNIRDSLDPYVTKANARVRKEELRPGESGTVAEINGKTVITVNSVEPEERQRFTICHEIAHKILGLPSDHKHVPQWGYAKRDINEVLCDIFAAELLMPLGQFKAAMNGQDAGLDTILRLKDAFKTSFPATASRYARLAEFPCAFVTMQGGLIKYAAMSTRLRAIGARIRLKSPIPAGSVAANNRAQGRGDYSTGSISQDIWFEDWEAGWDLDELCRHHKSSDTTVSLLWFEEEDAPAAEVDRFGQRVEEDTGLDELTGMLPWPKR